jgi:hypothetical protein
LPTSRDGTRRLWSDARGTVVEEKLGKLFEAIELRVPVDVARAEERRSEAARWRAEQRRWLVEQQRAEHLTKELAAWREARDIREYAADLRSADHPPELAGRLEEWCSWIEGRADLIDPAGDLSRLKSLPGLVAVDCLE